MAMVHGSTITFCFPMYWCCWKMLETQYCWWNKSWTCFLKHGVIFPGWLARFLPSTVGFDDVVWGHWISCHSWLMELDLYVANQCMPNASGSKVKGSFKKRMDFFIGPRIYTSTVYLHLDTLIFNPVVFFLPPRREMKTPELTQQNQKIHLSKKPLPQFQLHLFYHQIDTIGVWSSWTPIWNKIQ